MNYTLFGPFPYVNNWLKGNLDYLLRNETGLIVVEAKTDDLTRGFTQLAVEMIALALAEELSLLYLETLLS